MQFPDPCKATCLGCNTVVEARRKSLLRLEAVCSSCGASLRDVGLHMRKMIDDFGTLMATAELCVALKEVVTLRDIARVLARGLPPGADNEAHSLELVLKAARTIPYCKPGEIPLDLPIYEAICPDKYFLEREP